MKGSINTAYEKIRSLLVLGGGIAVLLLWFNLMGGQVHVIETLIGVALAIGTGIYLHFKLPKVLIGADSAS